MTQIKHHSSTKLILILKLNLTMWLASHYPNCFWSLIVQVISVVWFIVKIIIVCLCVCVQSNILLRTLWQPLFYCCPHLSVIFLPPSQIIFGFGFPNTFDLCHNRLKFLSSDQFMCFWHYFISILVKINQFHLLGSRLKIKQRMSILDLLVYTERRKYVNR